MINLLTSKLIEVDNLNDLINSNKPLIIVDFSSSANYSDGHIPNSIHLPFSALLSGQPPFPNKIPNSEQIASILSYINYRPDHLIVALDDEGGGWAGRFLWTLDVTGHNNWAYLNGGLIAWRAAHLPIKKGEYQPSNNEEISSTNNISADILTADEIVANINDDVQFWDARSEAEYKGIRSNSKRVGRIPNAIHCEWTSLMDANNHYRIRSDADDYLQTLGFDKNKTQITYCQSHHRSGFTWLVGTLLGYDVKGYDGSWNEWGNLEYTPIETG